MNAKSFILTGLIAAALCLATAGVRARGLVIRPAPATQADSNAATNAPPGEPQTEPNPLPRFGEPGDQGPIIPGHPGDKSLGPGAGNGSPSNQGDQSQVPMPVNRASYLIGMTVKNPRNETLGRIKDVIIDLKSSRVPYVVLVKYGRNHGTGSELAVPLSHFAPSADRTSLILNADRSQLDYAAGFSGDNLPSMNNPAFGAEPDSTRREIIIIPVPVHPNPEQNPDQNPEPDRKQHDTIPPHLHKGPTVERP